MAPDDLVRPSRDGDQFHYHWAARQCLELLPGQSDLLAVTIEGPSTLESDADDLDGTQLIDVGLYYGAEKLEDARSIRYVQLKHSTRRAADAWTASGLEKTIRGFAQRYAGLLKRLSVAELERRIRFEFTTNRPIEFKLQEALQDLANGAVARHQSLWRTLVKFTGLDEAQARLFFRLFFAEGGEPDLWAQRNLLAQDITAYLPDADYDTPIQLKELVTRKATTEFESNPSIRRYDVLRALKVTEEQLQPSPCLLTAPKEIVPREQEDAIREAFIAAKGPIVIHADGGVGKSMLALRLAASVPSGSESVLYDCFGDGLYRSALHFRHRHRDALVQIANELAGRGLCHPLIPSAHADAKAYMRAFTGRLSQAVGLLRGRDQQATLCLMIDAADNAEIAAEEQREASFVRDLIRMPLPQGVRLAFTCRTHRRWRLSAPPEAKEIELRPFGTNETAAHLRGSYPAATDPDVAEFAFLSSSNPRVQALALSRRLPIDEMLRQLGPTPTTVDRAIGELLESALARLKDQAGAAESSQIDLICQGLAVLRPLVPIPVLAQLSGTSENTVRSFALDLGRPLLVKGNSLHFLDEPAETWFRETFQPGPTDLARFLDRLRPLTAQSSYAASSLPQLLLKAGQLDELVELALSADGLPTANPLERRDVELQRLMFALKACLHQHRHILAAKLALKAGGECAGESRQNKLIQENTDVAAVLMAPDRIEEVVSRRTFGSGWMGSRHAYDAGLLSGRAEFTAEASSRLRMALDWLRTWARRPEDDRRSEEVDDVDRTELAMALLRLRGPDASAEFLRRWTWRRHAFVGGKRLAKRLIDLGQYGQIDALAHAAGNDVWLLLGLATESRNIGHRLPAAPLSRLLRLLADRRIKLPESDHWNANWDILYAVQSVVEIAITVLPPDPIFLGAVLRRYLPAAPPKVLAGRFGFDPAPMLRAYALEAEMREHSLTLIDVAPPDVRKELDASNQHGRSQETGTLEREVGGILAWFVLSAKVACGRVPTDLAAEIQIAVMATASAESRDYERRCNLRQNAAIEWLRILRDARLSDGPNLDTFRAWIDSQKESLWPDTLISLCHCAARAEGFGSLSIKFAEVAYSALEGSREDAESRADSYQRLARAVLTVSPAEASVYFNRAVEIASRIGDENLDRWSSLLHLGKAAGERGRPRSRTAYRLSRVAELTYEYVARDKHFDWDSTVDAMTDLCGSSALAILSRWRDRRFGHADRLLPQAVYRLIQQGQLPATTPIVCAGLESHWRRSADLKHAVESEVSLRERAIVAHIAYRYIRVQPHDEKLLAEVAEIGNSLGVVFQDIERLLAASRMINSMTKKSDASTQSLPQDRERRSVDWGQIFENIDFADANSLRGAYAALKNYDPPYEFDSFFREGLKRAKVGREPDFINAVADWSDFGIFELRYLLDAVPMPVPKMVSLRNALRDAVLAACRREPQRVRRRGWGVFLPFERLHAEGVVLDKDVVQATLLGFASQADTLSAGELFQLVDPLAACLSPDEAEEALNFGFDLLEDVLRPEDGDGPWSDALQPPPTCVSALAGYVWAGLGSPVVADRWQFAHVVRTSVEVGWADLLAALGGWAMARRSQPFFDQGLEFYEWHARLWLLIGLARGALERPTALLPVVSILQAGIGEEHVLIRAFSAQALQALVAAGALSLGDASDLGQVNRPQLPLEVYTGWRDTVKEETVLEDEAVGDDEKYHFGIDIGPYWFAPLGRAFGLNESAIENRARRSLREHFGAEKWAKHPDARYKRKIFSDRETWHSHGSMPKTDDLRAYHSYHAMMLVAAGLLKERPARQNADESKHEFQDWLEGHLLTRADGRWLADRRDPRLVQAPPAHEGYGDRVWCWSVTATYLDKQLIADDGLSVFWGHWTSGNKDDHETVSVRSALVSRDSAEALVAALQTASELDRFILPDTKEQYDLEAASLRLVGWVSSQHSSARLDEEDPWAQNLHYPGPAPSDPIVEKLALTPSTDERTWTAEGGGLVRSETWTHLVGYGREAEMVSGWRLCGDQALLKRLLESHPQDCLVLSVTVRRRPPEGGAEEDKFEPYPQPYARYYLMEKDGVPRAL